MTERAAADLDLRPLALVLAIGVLLLSGAITGTWILAADAYREVLARTLKVNAAASLALCAMSLALQVSTLRSRTAAVVLAAIAALVAAATLVEYAGGMSFGIDEIIARDARNAESSAFPGRMAPNAAITILLVAVSLILLRVQAAAARQLRVVLLALAAVASFFALAGYIFGAHTLYQVANYIRISPYTAVSLLLLSVGALIAWPQGTPIYLLVRRTSGGLLARRLLVPAAAAPLAIGWLTTIAVRLGTVSDTTGDALLAVGLVLTMAALVWINAKHLHRIDVRQNEARRIMEEALDQARKAVKLRDDFINLAGHELRTPLTSLLLRLQLLERTLPAQAGTIEPMKQQIRRLAALVQQMIDAAGLEASPPQRADVDLANVARDVADAFSREAGRVRADLNLDLRPAPVHADPRRMREAIEYLLHNAIKYGPGKPIEVQVGMADGHAMVAVQDHGIGISPEEQRRIFERFERAVPVENYGGLGLGLYLVREIAKAHGGSVRVESARGAGARFILSLPATRQPG